MEHNYHLIAGEELDVVLRQVASQRGKTMKNGRPSPVRLIWSILAADPDLSNAIRKDKDRL